METLSYILSEIEEIKIGSIYYFGQLWDGNGDGRELLEIGEVSPDDENIVVFEIVEENEDILQTTVKVIGFY